MSKAYWFVEPLSVLVLVETDLKKHISVKFSSIAQLCPTLCNPINVAHQLSLSITISWRLLKLMSIESVMPPNHFILSSPSPLAFNLPQHQRLFK